MYSGLSSNAAEKILKQKGLNEIPQKKTSLFSKSLKSFLSPLSLMFLAAAVLSYFIGKVFDGYFIFILLLLNISVSLWQENKADNAIQKLNENLAQKIKVFRDSAWRVIDSRMLVPGDIIQLGSGEVIPADGKIVEANAVSVNESAVTGESLPKDKIPADPVYSGTFLMSGIALVEITATGTSTNFGKTLFSVERIRKRSLLERDILNISKFLIVLSILGIVILSTVFIIEKVSFLELLTLDLSLLVAGIPVSLATVMTVIIEFGVLNLARKNTIVRRLSALEDLANVNMLLTDKTGTLTNNKIAIHAIFPFSHVSSQDVLAYSAISAFLEDDNPIDKAILDKISMENIPVPAYTKKEFVPFDPKNKRSLVKAEIGGKDITIAVGAPQIIIKGCFLNDTDNESFNAKVDELAKGGFRTLAVAVGEGDSGDKPMTLLGLLALSDELRPDAKSVVEFLKQNSINVAMVTGDNRSIASQISSQLALNETVVTKPELDNLDWNTISAGFFQRVGAFAEILPEDKLQLVQKAKQYFIVASNGDGINDLPALKAANVGVAVKNAVSALKATADIVLLSDGISVIKDAIIESRKIFERIYGYSLYRISESFRLICTITILGILYKEYPLTPLQIILIALLNDIPMITLAFDRVKMTNRPAKVNVKARFTLSSLFGSVGLMNSLFLFLLMNNIWHLDWNSIQTMFFLKLTVSGHLLIFVAHTKERWYKYLPSGVIIWATTLTQLLATTLALTGMLMPGRITLGQVVFVWIWSFFWMQVSEGAKILEGRMIPSDK